MHQLHAVSGISYTLIIMPKICHAIVFPLAASHTSRLSPTLLTLRSTPTSIPSPLARLLLSRLIKRARRVGSQVLELRGGVLLLARALLVRVAGDGVVDLLATLALWVRGLAALVRGGHFGVVCLWVVRVVKSAGGVVRSLEFGWWMVDGVVRRTAGL